MRRIVAFGPALVVLLVALGALWAVPRAVQHANAVRIAANVEASRRALDSMTVLEQVNAATRAIAGAVEPSVVHIDVRTDSGGSTGSGWVYNDGGHIITNAHVVRGARQVTVQFQDGLVVPARVLGADALTDIAVVKVDPMPGLFAATRGAPAVQQGDRVYAFGSPFGYKFSMSEGIISGLGRVAGPAIELGGFANLIQTDAAVNPGNSGGPLVDIKGRVIGMNVAIATARSERGTSSESGQSSGISFAIPVVTIEYVAEQLIQNGRVLRGMLGLQFPDPGNRTDQEAYAIYDNGQFRGTGLPVSRVTKGGPADVAGLREGDVVTAINGQPVASFNALRGIVGSIRPGERVAVRYWRDNRFIETTVVLAEMSAQALVGSGAKPFQFIAQQTGAVVYVDDAVRIYSLVPGSPFAAADFTRGTAILAVDDIPIRSFEDFAVQLIERGWLTGKDLVFSTLPPGAPLGSKPKQVKINLSGPVAGP